MAIVLAVNIYDFFSWLIFLLLPRLRYSFISQRVQMQQSVTTARTGMQAFVHEYLQQDGFFILRLVHSNVGDDVTSNLLTHLWKNFHRTDKVIVTENPAASMGATVSLTATGNRGLYNRQETQGASIFDYTKTSTNL